MVSTPQKTSPASLRRKKTAGEKIVMLTSYDAVWANLMDDLVDVQLVGDSVGTNVLGYRDITEVSLQDMCHHTRAVARGARKSMVLADMPAGTYSDPDSASRHADLLRQNGADAIKLEGVVPEIIATLTAAGMPVCAHIGFTPQTGGTRPAVKGKTFHEAVTLIQSAEELARAGACMIVLELLPAQLAGVIRSQLSIPVIGIGAGPDCDGEVQVVHDICGLSPRTFRHTKKYLEGRNLLQEAVTAYCREVRSHTFPNLDNCASVPGDTLTQVHNWLSERDFR